MKDNLQSSIMIKLSDTRVISVKLYTQISYLISEKLLLLIISQYENKQKLHNFNDIKNNIYIIIFLTFSPSWRSKKFLIM